MKRHPHILTPTTSYAWRYYVHAWIDNLLDPSVDIQERAASYYSAEARQEGATHRGNHP
jgi:hypothetical protein